MRSLHHYALLADLFEYPDGSLPVRVRGVRQVLTGEYPESVAALASFADALPDRRAVLGTDALHQVQEIFTRSFDVQAITTLSVGYVVFGDDYKRGELLVNLNRECRAAGVNCGTELSDHLPNVLRLLAVWNDPELVTEFVGEILRPALEHMIAEFAVKRMEQRDQVYRKHYRTLIASSATHGAMFRDLLVALLAVVDSDFPRVERTVPQRSHDFLRSITRELELEADDANPQSARSRT